MRTFKLIVEYDGTAYHGWQWQKGLASIQHVLENGIGSITQEMVRVIGSGRTDTGVHALHQVAHFKSNTSLPPKNLLLAINGRLPCDVVIKELTEVNEQFHARFDVKSKVYMYQIINGSIRSVLFRNYAWHIRFPLDIAAMRDGLDLLKGRHDFSSFCGKIKNNEDRFRIVHTASLKTIGTEIIRIYIEADGFLRYMVRNIVGTLVEVGMGKRAPDDIAAIIAAKERKCAGITAPPQGLFLMDVKY